MLVKTGLIPAAGSGTRLGPFTNAIPKELLPVGEKAVIEHVVCAMTLAEIEHIIIVVSPHKHGFSDYLGSGKRFGADISYVVQEDRKGLADAVLAGEHIIDSTFTVVLGDNFFYPKTFLKDLIKSHVSSSADTTVGVSEVADVTRHGIINPGNDRRILDMVEKPSPAEAKSRLGALGAYVFSPDIFDAIRNTKPGYKGELQLTDSIMGQIIEGKNVFYKKIDGIHIDVGTPKDLMKANEWYLEHRNGDCDPES